MFYVYRFKDKHEQIVYIGKTKNLKNRMSQHFSESGHLSQDKYNQVESIEYLELPTKIDMDIKELYYINVWKPEFNTVNKQVEEMTVQVNEESDEWIVFKSEKQEYINHLETEVNRLSDDLSCAIEERKQAHLLVDVVSDSNGKLLSEIELLKQRERAIVVNFNDSNQSIDNVKRFEIKEIETIYKYDKNPVFFATVKVDEIVSERFIIFNEKGRMMAKELISGLQVDWRGKDNIVMDFVFMMKVESCKTFGTDSDVIHLEDILHKDEVAKNIANVERLILDDENLAKKRVI